MESPGDFLSCPSVGYRDWVFISLDTTPAFSSDKTTFCLCGRVGRSFLLQQDWWYSFSRLLALHWSLNFVLHILCAEGHVSYAIVNIKASTCRVCIWPRIWFSRVPTIQSLIHNFALISRSWSYCFYSFYFSCVLKCGYYILSHNSVFIILVMVEERYLF